nr:MAG TPA: hypothetical protein [Caudoviricetes sp.]
MFSTCRRVDGVDRNIRVLLLRAPFSFGLLLLFLAEITAYYAVKRLNLFKQ